MEENPQTPRQREGGSSADNSGDAVKVHPRSASKEKECYRFFSPPRQRQKWGDAQILPHTNWGDLFFDLFYVGAAYNLSAILRASPTAEGVLYFVGCFGPIMLLWMDKMHYDSRFTVTDDDTYHRLFDVLQLVTLATAVLHIRPLEILSDPYHNRDLFLYCLAVTAGGFLTLIKYVEVWICVDDGGARHAARTDIRFKLFSTLWFLAATITTGLAYDHATTDYSTPRHTDVPIYLCLAGFVTYSIHGYLTYTFCLPGGDFRKYTVPMNIDFCIHRYGEWTMLMLGESILSLVIVESSDSFTYFLTFYSGVLSVILLQYLHFRSQPHSADFHAMRRSRHSGWAFSVLMQIYSPALVVIGFSYKMLLHEYSTATTSATVQDDCTTTDNHRLLMLISSDTHPHNANVVQRMVAETATTTTTTLFCTEERRQRITNFFSASMAIAWICLDLMILSHKGYRSNLHRCQNKMSRQKSFVAISLVLCRVALIVFIATLSRYETDPENVALIGLAGVICQIVLRVLGTMHFPEYGRNHHPSHHHHEQQDAHVEEDQFHNNNNNEEEDNEDSWPNVTHSEVKLEKVDPADSSGM